MSGFGERFHRAARERLDGFRRVAHASPLFSVRLRPFRQARNLVANAGAGNRVGVPQHDVVPFVVEPKTGLNIPGEFCMRGETKGCAPLMGMGVRVKRIAGVGVKVYACGLFLHPDAVKKAIGGTFFGKNPARVAKDQTLFDFVVNDHAIGKTVRLVFARDLESSKIADALAERLRPKLGAHSKSLKTFESYFENVKFAKGTSLTFCADHGKLRTLIKGKEIGVIDDKTMCAALFEVYLGKDPVVPGAKQSLGEKLAASVVG